MARATYREESTHCVSCGEIVPEGRLDRGAITCSDECGKKRRRMVRMRLDRKECRYCRKPSTPEQRSAFKRFAKLEMEAPHLLYPEEFAKWQEDVDGDTKGFAEWWKTKMAQEETDLREFNQGRPAAKKGDDADDDE